MAGEHKPKNKTNTYVSKIRKTGGEEKENSTTDRGHPWPRPKRGTAKVQSGRSLHRQRKGGIQMGSDEFLISFLKAS